MSFLGKYYLVDSEYPNTIGYLAPNTKIGVRYHVPDFQKYGPPTGDKETYNFLHSSLRMTIERSFGVLKNTWKILDSIMPQVSPQRQIDIIIGSCTRHNLIRIQERGIPISSRPTIVVTIPNVQLYDDCNREAMNEFRDTICNMISSSTNM